MPIFSEHPVLKGIDFGGDSAEVQSVLQEGVQESERVETAVLKALKATLSPAQIDVLQKVLDYTQKRSICIGAREVHRVMSLAINEVMVEQ